jgi:hypothetical protein
MEVSIATQSAESPMNRFRRFAVVSQIWRWQQERFYRIAYAPLHYN